MHAMTLLFTHKQALLCGPCFCDSLLPFYLPSHYKNMLGCQIKPKHHTRSIASLAESRPAMEQDGRCWDTRGQLWRQQLGTHSSPEQGQEPLLGKVRTQEKENRCTNLEIIISRKVSGSCDFFFFFFSQSIFLAWGTFPSPWRHV